jgi:ATP-dependent Clp protease ATP-binding subunit ClpC
MFERFSEKSRRVIFFARYEASQWGEQSIQPAHLLLGLLREDKNLFGRLPHSLDTLPNTAQELGLKVTGEQVSTSVDLPLSHESKRVLAYAAEESELLANPVIGTGHLLLGLLREPGVACALLERRGLTLAAVRAIVKDLGQKVPGTEQIVSALRAEFRAALGARLKPELEPAVVYSAGVEKSK